MDAQQEIWRLRQKMVKEQIESRGIKNERVLDAFRAVPRHEFVPRELRVEAYQDHPLPIGNGQTISQPYIVALMTEGLNLDGSEKVLEIGTGSGYQAAILSILAREVHSVERVPELAEAARAKLHRLGYRNVTVHEGDGTLGWPTEAPYDGILITAAAPMMPPGLVGQLAQGGRLVAPIGSRWRQTLEVWVKREGQVTRQEILPVVFVPLIGEEGWQEGEL